MPEITSTDSKPAGLGAYLEELHLSALAELYHLTLPQASKIFHGCIKKVAYELSLPLQDVYAEVISPEGIRDCVLSVSNKKDLTRLTEEQCIEGCSTVWFEGRCLPRYFPNADEINRDPDSFAKKLNKEELSFTIRFASYLYHNFEGGGLTDNSFDALEHIYNSKEKSRLRREELKAIGALPIPKLRTKLPYFMGSLEKVKPGQSGLNKFLGKPLRWSVKEDGVSALVIFSNGEVDRVYSRGDGFIGGDIGFVKEFIKLPEPKKFPNMVVRGELVMKTKVFEAKYSKIYATPRSMVSSRVNSGHVSPWLLDIDFVAYEIVDLRSPEEKPSDPFPLLELEGFETAIHGVFDDPTLFDLVEEYRLQRAASEYWIDGLVIHPLHGGEKVAFKMLLEEQVRWTEVISISWRATRTGRLFPKVHYAAIYVSGRRFTHSSGFNAAHIRDWNLRKGSLVKIVISGDIIPTISDVKEPENPKLANESYSLPPELPEWKWQGKDIVLVDPESNPDVLKARILYFWQVLGVRGLADKTVDKFYEAGYTTVNSIAALPSGSSIQSILFPKSKSITTGVKLYQNIHTALKTVRFDRLVPATGIFKNLGRKLIKEVLKYIPGMFVEPSSTLKKDLDSIKIPGVAAKRKEALLEGVPKVLEFLRGLSSEDFVVALANEKKRIELLAKTPKNGMIDGKQFVFTGFHGNLNFELEDYIYDNGGNITETIISETGALVCRNILDISKKMILANELKIPILTVHEFIRKFQIPFETSEEEFIEG